MSGSESKSEAVTPNPLPQNSVAPTTQKQSFPLKKRLMLGGLVLLVLPALAVWLWAWTTGQLLNFGMHGSRPASMSVAAAQEALLFAYLFALFIGLPLSALWSIVCIIIWQARKSPRGREILKSDGIE